MLAFAAQVRTLEGGDVDPVEHHTAFGRGFEIEDGAPEGRFATARLTDETIGLTPVDLQVDSVDGENVSDRLVEDDAALDREVDLDAANIDEDLADRRGG